MSDPTDMEALAALEHESWAKWTKWMLGEMERESGAAGNDFFVRDTVMGLQCIRRWQRQMETPYADLSEKEKESDRKVVREKLPLYRPTVVPVHDEVGGPKVGSAVLNKDGTATITLDDSPAARAILDKIINPPGFGISSQGVGE